MGVQKEVSWLRLASNTGKPDEGEEESWQLFDCCEKGLMRSEAPKELLRPCSQWDRLQRFLVVRSTDGRGYQLYNNDGDALMNAIFSSMGPKVEFFLYNPSEKTYEANPAFSMTYGDDKSTWLLVEEQWGSCPSSPSSPLTPWTPFFPSTPTSQPRQLALIRHFCEDVGGGLARCMEVSLPSHPDGSSRHVSEQVDLRRGRGAAHHLVTRLPDWDAARRSLTLAFDGRLLQGSAKNFQLALQRSPKDAVFQHGKLGANAFCLDFKAPLSIVQAFGASVSAAYWA